MLLVEISQMMEMARPAKICPDCGKSMAGNHYWYKGGWKCKKSSLADKKGSEEKKEAPAAEKKTEEKKPAQKNNAPANNSENNNDKKEHTGAVKGLEREAGEEQDPDVKAADAAAKKAKTKKVGDTISASEMREISAETEAEAREYVNKTFPKASAESKARAMNYWKRSHKEA